MISGVREVLAGIKATRQLLKGSKPILSSRKGRSDYVKQGDYGTAIGDFFALRPSDIQDSKHSNVWTTHNMNTSILINPRDHKTRNHRKTPSLIDFIIKSHKLLGLQRHTWNVFWTQSVKITYMGTVHVVTLTKLKWSCSR